MNIYKVIEVSDKGNKITNFTDANKHLAYQSSLYDTDKSVAMILPDGSSNRQVVIIMKELSENLVMKPSSKINVTLGELEVWIEEQKHLHKLRSLK